MYAYTCLMIFGFIMVTSFDISLYCKSVFNELWKMMGVVRHESLHGKYGKREVTQMDTYQILSLLFLGGNFLMALLTYLDSRDKRK